MFQYLKKQIVEKLLSSPASCPPDPTNPSSFSFSHFPPLSFPGPQKSRTSPQTALSKVHVDLSSGHASPVTTDVEMAQPGPKNSEVLHSSSSQSKDQTTVHMPLASADKSTTGDANVEQRVSSDVEMAQVDNASPTPFVSSPLVSRSESIVPQTLTQEKNFTIIPPKASSPIQTNKASSSTVPSPVLLPNTTPTLNPNQEHSVPPKSAHYSPNPTLADIKVFDDKSLKRLAPVTYYNKGTPRVLIPDEVSTKVQNCIKTLLKFATSTDELHPTVKFKVFSIICGERSEVGDT